MPYGFSERMAEEAEKQFPPMPNTILYTVPDCPKCHQLALWLQEQQIPFQTRNLQNPAVITDLRLAGCFEMQAPILQIGSEYKSSGWIFTGQMLETKKLREALQ